MKTKPVEELYDLEMDPHEINNLALDSNYTNVLFVMRKELQLWQKEVNDRGFIPESEIIKEFWPNMIQPITSEVIIRRNDNEVHLICETKGASIGYQTGDSIGSKYWELYTKAEKNEFTLTKITSNKTCLYSNFYADTTGGCSSCAPYIYIDMATNKTISESFSIESLVKPI